MRCLNWIEAADAKTETPSIVRSDSPPVGFLCVLQTVKWRPPGKESLEQLPTK